MLIYVIEILMLWVFNLICFHAKEIPINRKKLFLFLSITMLTIVLGLRGNSTGEDTMHYVTVFYQSDVVPWNTIFRSRNFRTAYITYPTGYTDTIENGILILGKIVHIFTNNPQVFLFIISAITMGFLAKFIYEESIDVFMSTYILTCESIYMFAFNGARQSMALAISINSFTQIKKKHYIKAILLILAGAFFHNSALIYFLMFPIMLFSPKNSNKTYKRFKWILGGLICIPFSLPIAESFVVKFLPRYISYFTNPDDFWTAQLGGSTILLILELILIIYMYRMKFKIKYAYEYSVFTLLFIVFFMIGTRLGGIERLALYFRAFLILFYPIAIASLNSKKYKKFLIYGVYILMSLFFLSYAGQETRIYQFLLK